ncbi:polysaccharide lyase 8 family protein [Paenibacillus swuensis]|uniref:polysaccharide lyase 8 family protein n=1 Tax=Paenibacillus swuensis TaxID=1178515 RepID=UPI00083955CD|nr:polysaccharide lyase 8 family protein [Paenibacillus swuensis]
MNIRNQRNVIAVIVLALVFSLFPFFPSDQARAAQPYDGLRSKWKEVLTGGTSYDPTDSVNAQKIADITATAQADLNTMQSGTNRTTCNCLWTSLNSTTDPAHITKSYTKLKGMALAYSTTGSTLKGNTTLRDAIISGMDWMHTNRFYVRTAYGNWWDWEIGIPLAVNDIMILMYSDFTAAQRANWIGAIDHFSPNQAGLDYKYWGANRVWRSMVHVINGIISESSTKMVMARDGLSDLTDGHTGGDSVFTYVTRLDGFYEDGSFIQHGNFAYTGGYGKTLLKDIAHVMYILNGTTWEVTDPNSSNVWKWVYDSYEPLMYKNGLIMDMVRGREISRPTTSNLNAGHQTMVAIIRLSQIAPPGDAYNYKRMIKYWIGNDNSFYSSPLVSLNMIQLGKAIMNDAAVTPRGELVKNKMFADMDRVVHLRPGYGFGLSMHSTRIYNYEYHSGNRENKKGWYTGDGMTYLYDNDTSQYTDDYWPTVNPYRLPGTTVDTQTRTDGSYTNTFGGSNWVGGVSNDQYGAAGMLLKGDGTTLEAKKSWFMFDDEVVSLGTGISSTDNRTIESIIENRKLNASGSNAWTVNGTLQSTSLTQGVKSFNAVSSAHIAGNVSGSDVGYYFPMTPNLKGLREARTNKWSDVNGSNVPEGDPSFTRNYMTMWFDHGANPTAGSYQYVTLPGMSTSQTTAYAGNPDIEVLENSAEVQAVKDNTLNVIGANFWNDQVKGVTVGSRVDFLKSNKKASVLTKETSGEFEISVSDPTQANTGTITIDVGKNATGLLYLDSNITVNQLSPLRITVNVNGSSGKTFKAKFSLNTNTTIVHEAEAVKAVSPITQIHRESVDAGCSAGECMIFEGHGAGDYVLYKVNVPEAKVYNVKVGVKKFHNRGKAQLSIAGTNYGPVIDQYNSTAAFAEQDLGDIAFTSNGWKYFKFSVTDKNALSSDFNLSYDYIKLTPR